jgi:hypothetical protein
MILSTSCWPNALSGHWELLSHDPRLSVDTYHSSALLTDVCVKEKLTIAVAIQVVVPGGRL